MLLLTSSERCRGDNGQKQVLGAGTKQAAGSWLHRPHPAPPASPPPSLCHPDTPSPGSKLFHGQALGAAASLLLPRPAPVPSCPQQGDDPGARAAAASRVLQRAGAPPAPTPQAGHILHPPIQLGISCMYLQTPNWAPPAPPDPAGHILHPLAHLVVSCTPDPAGHLLHPRAPPAPQTQAPSGSRHAHKPPSLSPSRPATQQIFHGGKKDEHFPSTGSSALSSRSCQHREGARPWGGLWDAGTIGTVMLRPLARQCLAHQHSKARPTSTVMLSPSAQRLALLGSPVPAGPHQACVSPPTPGAGVDGGRLSAGFQGQLQSE